MSSRPSRCSSPSAALASRRPGCREIASARRQLKTGAVTGPKLAHGSVTQAKVAPGSLSRSDFPPGSIGTIGGIDAGTGLTGGGSSGTVTLNADETRLSIGSTAAARRARPFDRLRRAAIDLPAGWVHAGHTALGEQRGERQQCNRELSGGRNIGRRRRTVAGASHAGVNPEWPRMVGCGAESQGIRHDHGLRTLRKVTSGATRAGQQQEHVDPA